MEPTLHGCAGCTGDRIVVEKIGYRFGDPKPGDVVVFRARDSWNDEFVSQSIRQFGDSRGTGSRVLSDSSRRTRTIWSNASSPPAVRPSNAVTIRAESLVDGKPLNEPYIQDGFPVRPRGRMTCDTELKSGRCFGPVTVPEGNVWVMGDNREQLRGLALSHRPTSSGHRSARQRDRSRPFHRASAVADRHPDSPDIQGR